MPENLSQIAEESSISVSKSELLSRVRIKYVKPLDSVKSFDELSELTQVSPQTLRRLFGKIKSSHKTNRSTLSMLCQYIGYKDWDSFCLSLGSTESVSKEDKDIIDAMEIFFKNGEKYQDGYHQNTTIVGTLNEYTHYIYKSLDHFKYFYEKYRDNPWVVEYILAWVPNYNLFGTPYVRQAMEDLVRSTKVNHVKLSQTNLLCFGALMANDDAEFSRHFKTISSIYEAYQADGDYMPYHEMRYTTVQLMDGKSDPNLIIKAYLRNLEGQNLSSSHKQELLVFFANTLIWLRLYEEGFELLQEAKYFYKPLQEKIEKSYVHYFGMNFAFLKVSFALLYKALDKPLPPQFEIEYTDFTDQADLLYHRYTKGLYLVYRILLAKSTTQKKSLMIELSQVIEKTHYTRLYNILRDLDPDFSRYTKDPLSS
ncbi:hypothetical protein [Chryseobacterium sp. A321]